MLRGFQSTSQDINIALNFMLTGITNEKQAVLYKFNEIDISNSNFFSLNSNDYSVFTNESEVLILDGESFKISDISE